MVAAGIVALVYPLFTSIALVSFLGWLLIISGIVQGISLIGAISPDVSSIIHALLTLTLLIVVFFMVEGISKVIFALTIRPFPNWGWVLASGVIGIVLAIYLWSSPASAIWLLGLLVGILLISEGAALGYLAWQVRKT